MKIFIVLSLILFSPLLSQLKITSIEKLPVPQSEYWSNPIFSPSGKEIYYTNMEYNGIWQYSIASKLVKVITVDKSSGYNFAISDDGQKIAYRRTAVEGDHVNRVQEIIELDLRSFSKTVIDQGTTISTPMFFNQRITTLEKISKQKISSPMFTVPTKILGIEETKIVLLENGSKKIFDPLGDGQYIWPQLSPDGKKIVAVDMRRSTFVCDLDGSNVLLQGRLNAPQWERNGYWIIGMEDIDDGHRLVFSDIVAKSLDGKKSINLTEEFTDIAMNPSCSPVENKIAFNTHNGNIFIMSYDEVK